MDIISIANIDKFLDEQPFPPQHVSVVEFSSLDVRSSEWDDDLTQVKMRMNNSTNIVIAIAIIIGAELKCQTDVWEMNLNLLTI